MFAKMQTLFHFVKFWNDNDNVCFWSYWVLQLLGGSFITTMIASKMEQAEIFSVSDNRNV